MAVALIFLQPGGNHKGDRWTVHVLGQGRNEFKDHPSACMEVRRLGDYFGSVLVLEWDYQGGVSGLYRLHARRWRKIPLARATRRRE